ARILSYRQKETLSISEKIASLDPKIDFKEDKRKRIIKAVFDLQNSQRSKSANVTRFNSWLLLINLLKKVGFSLLYPVRNFKNIFTVHRFPPPAGSQFTANLKQQR
ncbi:hypothetical protein EXT54_14445, partial [Pectobacterium atrosepticum]|nr:hypothetical protein [Pectobacterium atrosepticum]